MNRKTCKKAVRFFLTTIVLVIVTAFFAVSTVMSQSKTNIRLSEKYYDELEQEYLKGIKEILKESGFNDSGINVTYVTDENDGRVYDIVIYNRMLKNMDKDRKKILTDKIAALFLENTTCGGAGCVRKNALQLSFCS